MKNTIRRLNMALCNIDAVYLADEKHMPVSANELYLMYALDDGEPHTQAEISRTWLLPKTTVNTIAKHWEKDGLITQTPIPECRRSHAISLTEKGRRRADELLQYVYSKEAAALAATVARYGTDFIDAIEAYGEHLKRQFAAGEDA